jgi:hypothetical protein
MNALDMTINNKASEEMLRSEIQEFGDTLALQINVIAPTNTGDSDEGNLDESGINTLDDAALRSPDLSKFVIGQANVELWGMLESKVPILRQVLIYFACCQY